MKYPEYLSSAKRHNHACKVIQSQIELLSESAPDSEELNFLVLSLYYLSGYIIECSLKFKIFELSNYNKNTDVDKIQCDLAGINYDKRIKTHNFSSLQNYLDSLIGDISHLSGKKEINRLLSNWNPELRYSHSTLNYTHIKEFYTHTSDFLKKM